MTLRSHVIFAVLTGKFSPNNRCKTLQPCCRQKSLLHNALCVWGWVAWLLLAACAVNADDLCQKKMLLGNDTSPVILACEQQISAMQKTDTEYVSKSLLLARLYEQRGDLSSAETLLKKIISETPDMGATHRVKSLRQLGIVYLYRRMYEDALTQFEQATELATQNNLMSLVALGYNDLAIVYRAFGDYDYASELYLQSYDLHKQVGNRHGQASTLANLGTMYRDRGSFDEAIVAYRRAYSIYGTVENHLFAAMTLANIGKAFHRKGELDKAIELLSESIEDLNQVSSYRHMSSAQISLSQVYLARGDHEEAHRQLDLAKRSLNLTQSSVPNPRYWYSRGLILEAQGDLPKALKAFEAALEHTTEDANYKFQGMLYFAVAKLAERMDNFERASQYWQRYAHTLDEQLSLKNAIRSRQITKKMPPNPAQQKRENGPNTELAIAFFAGIIAMLAILAIKTFIALRLSRKNTAQVIPRHTNEPDKHKEKTEPAPSADTERDLEHESTTLDTDSTDSEDVVSGDAKQAAFSYTEKPNPKREWGLHKEAKLSSAAGGSDVNNDRQNLVELMHLALQLWEEQTELSKLELAERSKVWSVGVDDGRLRARAMERYFSVRTLPQQPRWRSVVRTCNYVLRNCEEKSLYRSELEQKLKSFQSKVKRNATIVSISANDS